MLALHRIILYVAWTSQLYAVILAVGYLPRLQENRLSEGDDRDLPNAIALNCGGVCITEASIKSKVSIYDALTTDNFNKYAFTAGPVSAPGAQTFDGDVGTFSFVEIKGTRHWQYVLQVDSGGHKAYWLPQGGWIDIPSKPKRGEPRYVFTPDFSGCTWTVTPLENGYLRIRHVEGTKEASQFNNKSPEEKGGPRTFGIEYKDYGYVVETKRLVSNVPAFAYMRYLPEGGNGRWSLRFQRKTCSDIAGGFMFSNDKLTRVMLVETSSYFPQAHSTKMMIVDV